MRLVLVLFLVVFGFLTPGLLVAETSRSLLLLDSSASARRSAILNRVELVLNDAREELQTSFSAIPVVAWNDSVASTTLWYLHQPAQVRRLQVAHGTTTSLGGTLHAAGRLFCASFVIVVHGLPGDQSNYLEWLPEVLRHHPVYVLVVTSGADDPADQVNWYKAAESTNHQNYRVYSLDAQNLLQALTTAHENAPACIS